jgi:hypothetical protein
MLLVGPRFQWHALISWRGRHPGKIGISGSAEISVISFPSFIGGIQQSDRPRIAGHAEPMNVLIQIDQSVPTGRDAHAWVYVMLLEYLKRSERAGLWFANTL